MGKIPVVLILCVSIVSLDLCLCQPLMPLVYAQGTSVEIASVTATTPAVDDTGLLNTNVADLMMPNPYIKKEKFAGFKMPYMKIPYCPLKEGLNSSSVRIPEKATILVILVEFTDYKHNMIPEPTGIDEFWFYWVPDFNVAHYYDLLFNSSNPLSMYSYYRENSYGIFTVDGAIYACVTVNNSMYYYGRDSAYGIDDYYGPIYRLVTDAVHAADPYVDFSQFDTNGDGVVDHLMVIHAYMGQEEVGWPSDTIWSHRYAVLDADLETPGTQYLIADGVCIFDYTMICEDGTLGTFAHEFAHDLGLLDLYNDLNFAPVVGFWSLMDMGSWGGVPAGTKPTNLDAWSKYVLGWATPPHFPLHTRGAVPLYQSETLPEVIRIDLPPKTTVMNTPHSGEHEWWSSKADRLVNNLTLTVDLTGFTTATLTFWEWFAIEEGWDYGWVLVSSDKGLTWTSLPGTYTTMDDPNRLNIYGNGITGSSPGWVQETVDLSAYAGRMVLLRFEYRTDEYVTYYGWFIDDVLITGDGVTIFLDDVELVDPRWTAEGWIWSDGTRTTNQYYLLEWRQRVGFDEGLPDGGLPYEWMIYNPRLIVWHRDMLYEDNWIHLPGRGWGEGMLLLEDAHPYSTIYEVDYWSDYLSSELMDATFSLKPTAPCEANGYTALPGNPLLIDTENKLSIGVLWESPDEHLARIRYRRD